MTLEVKNLSIKYPTEDGAVYAVNDAGFKLNENEILSIVGESGCGKSTIIKSIIGLLDDGEIFDGSIVYNGQDISELSEKELNDKIRWEEISYIPQDAMSSLDPVYTIQTQLIQVIREHTDYSKSEAKERAKELLQKVDIDESRLGSYPHELSGGQKQRVIIALSLALEPKVIIADEPTTGLDVVVKKQILDLMDEIKNDIDCSILMVTHDISAVNLISDRVCVMYAGEVMEIGPVKKVTDSSANPYTIGLSNSFPSLEKSVTVDDMVHIPGSPPELKSITEKCPFISRCPFSTKMCKNKPDMYNVDDDHITRCHFPNKVDEFREKGGNRSAWVKEEAIHE